jgi:adenine-specific DNA-methyltransferase
MSDSVEFTDNGVISDWAQRLGLASSNLFGRQDPQPLGTHFALLDGRRASFACSIMEGWDVSAAQSRDWQWSADLAHHVLVTSTEVIIRSGTNTTSRHFERASVEQRLDDFHIFLDSSRRGALPDIIPFLVDEFLQLWGMMPVNKGLGALAVFLLSLEAAGEGDSSVIQDVAWRKQQARFLGLEGESLDILSNLQSEVIQRAKGLQSRAPDGLRVVPGLVLRHASGRLFQEAHAYLESAQLNLWGGATVQTVPTLSPTGAYFTPVPIARLIADTALQSIGPLPDRITVADFTCGSGVFLCELLRELDRRGYQGQVRLIGRDLSSGAVTMANVAVTTTVRDLGILNFEIDIKQVNMLEETAWPTIDIALMNPPFRSWEHMADHERDWVKIAMHAPRGRPDLSVGFIEYALRAVRPGGVLATLLPAGVLASEGLTNWRNTLAERSTPTLIAVLGEHGLFRQAFVNVGILVLKKDSNHHKEIERRFSVAWASPESGAASEAIRALRRRVYLPSYSEPKILGQSSWSVTQTSLEAWKERVSWLPGPGVLGPLLESLQSTISTRVEDLFHVRQGIRTGANDVFVLSTLEFNALPVAERNYFSAAVDAASFDEGEIHPSTYLFVPDKAWQTEGEVRKAVPEFFRLRLKPAKDRLVLRKKINPELWWRLTWSRNWAFDGLPRLISKRFGLYPAFARDLKGDLAVVQANAWVPTKKLSSARKSEAIEILTEYWWLLNSRIMVALFREYCPNVAGGQFDLERKYVRHVPLPNLLERRRANPWLQDQSITLRASFPTKLPPLVERDRFAAAAFGTSVKDWPISLS